jgi:hypothetical protein
MRFLTPKTLKNMADEPLFWNANLSVYYNAPSSEHKKKKESWFYPINLGQLWETRHEIATAQATKDTKERPATPLSTAP